MKVSIGKHNKKTHEQKISVRVDPWDTYCCATTLAHIVIPLLREFKVRREKMPGVPTVFLPEGYDGSPEMLEEGEKKYLEVINKMEWSFQQIINEPDLEMASAEDLHEYNKKVQEGFDLFGKHMTTLWW